MNNKTISIITPTFNSIRTIHQYLGAILMQDYPHDLIEIIITDGGSTDGTLEFLEKEKTDMDIPIRVYDNPLKTAEAGKAKGVKKAKNDIILLLDSDNILPSKNWLNVMIAPFDEHIIIASEPLKYTYRRKDTVINRYCALIGMNDPLCMFIGNYDRYCCLTHRWTEIERDEIDKGGYLSVRFPDNIIPTIGANGFLIRKKDLLDNFNGDYLFDIDILYDIFRKNADLRVAKVKTGIIHLFCPDLRTFYRKQNRRIQDYLFFSEEKGRSYPWHKVNRSGILYFIICCITIIPLILQATEGYRYKKDFLVWLYHPILCWVTLYVYGIGTIKSLFFKKEAASRNNWKQ